MPHDMPKRNSVIAHIPAKIPISSLASTQALRIDVKISGYKEGQLNIGQGSIEWWPDYNKVNAHHLSWRKFIDALQRAPKKRAKRRLKKT